MKNSWENTVIVPITETAFNLFVSNTNRKTGETLCEALSRFIEDNIKIDGPHGLNNRGTAKAVSLPFTMPHYLIAIEISRRYKIDPEILQEWWDSTEKPTIDHFDKPIKSWKISLLVYNADKENERIEKIGEKIRQQESGK
ncbi:MAG: hypothetical protein LBU89_04835 [Fibromonadaceae bacterium]|jgi:hypothetical protein|nr:hypothetical protein [Fibromonadaceae bacterium]